MQYQTLCKSAWSGMSGFSGSAGGAEDPIDPLDWTQFANLIARYDFSDPAYLQQKTVADFVRADSDQLSIADNATFVTDDSMSLVAWIKPDDNTTSSFVSKYGDVGDREFTLRSVSGGPRFYISSDGTNVAFASAGAINTSVWNFFVGRHDSTLGTEQIKIYHGTSAGAALSTDTTTIAGNRFNSTSPFTISNYASVTEHMDGRIGPVCMFSVALTDAQVTWLYNSGTGRSYNDISTSADVDNPGTANMISYWTLGEVSGIRADTHGTNDLSDVNTVSSNHGYIGELPEAGMRIAVAVDQEGTDNLAQNTEANKPILEEKGLYNAAVFDGSTDYMQISFPGGASTIIDDEDAGQAFVGSWTQSTTAGRGGDHYFSAAGVGSDTSTWTFTVTPGLYRVYATWPTSANRATNSPFTIKDNTTAITTVLVNQELAQSDLTESGSNWKELGTFNITSTTLAVTLTDNANEFVIADAILIKPVSSVQQPTTLFVVADFESDGTQGVVFDGSDFSNRQAVGLTSANKLFIQANTQVIDANTDSRALAIYTVQFDGASSLAWRNGSPVISGDSGTRPVGGYTVASRYDGAADFFNGDVYEVVLADAIMSDADMNIIGQFFGDKYGIGWSDI